MRESPKKTISVLVPMELYEKLSEEAEHSSRYLSAYVRQVLKAHLQYMERFRRR